MGAECDTSHVHRINWKSYNNIFIIISFIILSQHIEYIDIDIFIETAFDSSKYFSEFEKNIALINLGD